MRRALAVVLSVSLVGCVTTVPYAGVGPYPQLERGVPRRIIPGVDLYQESKASKETIGYLKETHDHSTELSAYKILYPAYGTYVGGYLFPPIGTVAGALVGHVAGRSKPALKARQYQRAQPPPAVGTTTPPALAPSPDHESASATP